MKTKLSSLYFKVFIAFLYAPILVLIVFSFNESKGRHFTGFTLKWYKSMFNNPAILDGLKTTLIIAFSSAIIATIMGTLAAMGIANIKGKKKLAIMNFTYLPILNPEIITGVSFMLLFVTTRSIMNTLHLNFEFGWITLLIAHITINVPYVILNVIPKISQMDKSLIDASMDLGCNPIQAFFKVVIHEIKPGIFAGFVMALTFSLDDFVVSYFTTGVKQQPLSVLIYSMTKKRVSPEINALSTVIFLIVLVTLLVINRKQRLEEERNTTLKNGGDYFAKN